MRYKCVLWDLDGVLWRGYKVEKMAPSVIQSIRGLGINTGVVTNTSARSRQFLSTKLRLGGIDIPPDDIVTSARIATDFIESKHGKGNSILVLGKHGNLRREFQLAGFSTIDPSTGILKVNQDIIACFGYCEQLRQKDVRGILAIAPYVTHLYASDRDRWYGSTQAPLPGGGWIISAIETLLNKTAITLGKPSAFPIKMALSLFNCLPSEVLMVGDSIDNDIGAAAAAGVDSAFLMNSFEKEMSPDRANFNLKPTYQINKLSDVLDIVKSVSRL
jgi:4-nitrophenyl phosphatase